MPTCRKIEALLLSEPDGVLTASELAELEAHVVACEACRRERILISEVSTTLKESRRAVVPPSPLEEWESLRKRIHDERRESRKSQGWGKPWLRWGIPSLSLGAAAAVAFVLYLRAPSPAPVSLGTIARAEFVQSESAKSTLVYVDQESGWLIVWADSPDSTTKG
ncbi:MAG: zf-HC2 domain-containing protein [Opitutaceae bacterium]|nr:zf-HC2 domain-containing protein [Opitutaceae bacterium]